ncbi:MAG: LUD domain-containing protein [Bacteroidales bacterium]|nr:LUD domain-containing protein [Bacteroidales bacterium]
MNKAATKAVSDIRTSGWQDETLWIVRSKRDRVSKEIPEWEALRDAASAIKSYSNTHLPLLLEQFEQRATENGAIVHWAADAAEYREIIGSILQENKVRKFVKSKSMLSEECELRPYLESLGIETVETDLGERIIQLMESRPSHIVLPAIHVKREQVAELFNAEMAAQMEEEARAEGLENAAAAGSDPTFLTRVARRNLRKKFLEADAAMTGANFAVASTGEVVVCTNEGNADMGTSCAPLQIAAFGIDKIVPDRRSLGVFTRLLARSATGQAVTAYTTHYSAPKEGSRFHIIIVDNGRSRILADAKHRKLLNCLRCGSCMNTCPVFRRIGGYAYSYFIPGPLGTNLGMTKEPERFKDNLSLCSLCHSCSFVCPAKVDLAEQIYDWRQDYHTSAVKRCVSGGMNTIMKHPSLFDAALKAGRPGMKALKAMGFSWGKGREFPDIKKK